MELASPPVRNPPRQKAPGLREEASMGRYKAGTGFQCCVCVWKFPGGGSKSKVLWNIKLRYVVRMFLEFDRATHLFLFNPNRLVFFWTYFPSIYPRNYGTEIRPCFNEASAPKSLPKQAAPFIIASGQLVHIQILAQPTIENFTVPQIDPSYWFDPSLSKENWRTIPRPAVVLKSWRNQDGRVNIKVALLTTRSKESSSHNILLQPEGKLRRTADFCVAVSGMLWPKLDVWCCAYLGTYIFTCLPTQVCRSSKISIYGSLINSLD